MNTKSPFEENADLIRAVENASPSGRIPFPEQVLFKIESVRRSALQERNATHGGLESVSRHSSTSDTAAPSKIIGFPLKNVLQFVSALALFGGGAAIILFGSGNFRKDSVAMRTANIRLISPQSVADSTRPVIAWESKEPPGQLYDVWILPAGGDYLSKEKAPALFEAKAVSSPIDFARLDRKQSTDHTLKAGEEYRVLVCLAGVGRMSGAPVTFKITPAPAP